MILAAIIDMFMTPFLNAIGQVAHVINRVTR